MYWYVPRSKVAMLAEERRRGSPLRRMSLKVAAMGVEAGAELEWNEAARRELRTVRARLDNDREVQALEDPEAEPTSIFRFHGRAARAIQSETYYVAVLTPGTAVLLTGWVGHVVGQAPTEKVQLSPSAHPLAAASSFAGGDGGDGAGKALSYAWQAVYRSAGGPGVTLPVVGGLAVFAGAYPASAGRSTASGCCA